MTNIYIPEVVIFGLIALGVVIWFIRWWDRSHRPLPTFCTKCGCPLDEVWNEGYPRFDSAAGTGQRTDRKVLRCPKYYGHDNLWHDFIELNETRTVTVEARCGE